MNLISHNSYQTTRKKALSTLFWALSLLFSFSIIGLFVNVIVNPASFTLDIIFIVSIVGSLALGISINVLDRLQSQRQFRRNLDAILKDKF
jgi:uncharacterized membrane protein YczE